MCQPGCRSGRLRHFLGDTASNALQSAALENPMHRMSHPSVFFTPLRLLAVGLLAVVLPVQAQNQIYRCGTEYTNSPTAEQKKTCKALDGGNVTVIQAPKPKSSVAGAKPLAPVPASNDQAKVDPGVQKARDSDARAILESEQRRAEQRLAELQREYNGGQPERRGEEVRNQQRYSERVATLKDSLTRAEADLAGIRRELSRAGGGITVNANAANTAPLSR